MIIETTDYKGNKIQIDYEAKLIPEPKESPDMDITTFEDFQYCLEQLQIQKQYVGGGDQKYLRALGKFHAENNGLYQEYTKRLEREVRAQYGE